MNETMRLESRKCWLALWLVGYVAMIAVVAGSLVYLREGVLREKAKPESLRAWESWRNDVRDERRQGSPVERRVPKSAEPPVLVLMRDYFVVMLSGALVFTSLLYIVLAWLVTGVATFHSHGDHGQGPAAAP